MRRFLLAVALLASGAVSLVVLLCTAPLIAAMRADRRERNRLEALYRERWPDLVPYDDDDLGVDVDGNPDEVVA